MTEISQKTITHLQNSKTYITEYWHKRTVDFSKLRRQELLSPKYQLWQQELLQQLPQKQQLKILDIGCGAGFFSVILAKENHLVTGIDLTPDMITAAREIAADEQLQINFQIMDAENLTFADECFDAVISRNLTWNLPDPAKAYQEWLRVLKKGGILLNYDAEYAKNHHNKNAHTGAHADIDNALLEECHKIYHMLDISCYERPQWDLEILQQLQCSSVTADLQVGTKIYSQQDNFYIPVPMFCIKAKK